MGKWHLGHFDRKYWPNQRGFDYSYGPLIGEIDHFKHSSHGVTDWYRNNNLIKEPGYDTQLFGADAVRQIEAHDTKSPLFLYLAFTAPHTPYQAPQDYLDRYNGIGDPLRRAYAAQITCMDDEIGKVIAALEKRGMRDNTLIVFCSDNGGTRSNLFVGEAGGEGRTAAEQRSVSGRQRLNLRGRNPGGRAGELARPDQARRRRRDDAHRRHVPDTRWSRRS